MKIIKKIIFCFLFSFSFVWISQGFFFTNHIDIFGKWDVWASRLDVFSSATRWMSWWETFYFYEKPYFQKNRWKIYNAFEKKFWKEKFQSLLTSWDIWIIWVKYWSWENREESIYWYDNIARQTIVYNSSVKEENIKIVFSPFQENVFLWQNTSEYLQWYPQWRFPKITFIDSSLEYDQLELVLLGENWYEWSRFVKPYGNSDITYTAKKKYRIEKFWMKRDALYSDKKEYLYQIVPYYEFEIPVKKWENYTILYYENLDSKLTGVTSVVWWNERIQVIKK
jgi:hypothetical protein